MTEQQVYTVIATRAGYEIRHYPAHVVADVEMTGTFERAGNAGFGPLVSYISGRNQGGQKVAMTAPVIQAPTADPDRHHVRFVMPSGATRDTLPTPAAPGVVLIDIAEGSAAVASFSGRWTESSYRRHVDDLLKALARDGLEPAGPARYARFDPPWKPWMLRRNEVVIPLVPQPEAAGS